MGAADALRIQQDEEARQLAKSGLEEISQGQGKGAKKLRRIRFLLDTLERQLEHHHADLEICLYGVVHDHPHDIESLKSPIDNADFVTLELPNATVRNYFTKGPESVTLWNEFWIDVLNGLKKRPPRGGVFGVNDSAIRYPRRRLHAEFGDRFTEGTPIPYEESAVYSLGDLGGDAEGTITAAQLLEALPLETASDLRIKQIAHLLESQNPFGPKHLILFKPMSASLKALFENIRGVLLKEFTGMGVHDAEILSIVSMEIVEPILSIYNDHDQTQRMLERLNTALRDGALSSETQDRQHLRFVHVGGHFHNPILKGYLELKPAEGLRVVATNDIRFLQSEARQINPRFLEATEEILDHIFLSDKTKEVEVDVEYFTGFLTRMIQEDKEFFQRKIFMAAITDHAVLTDSFPMVLRQVAEKFGQQELTLEWGIVHRILHDFSLDELSQLHRALDARERIYRNSPHGILREIIKAEMMELGEMAVFYVDPARFQDKEFMSMIKDLAGAESPNMFFHIPQRWFLPQEALFELERFGEEFEIGWKGDGRPLRQVREDLTRAISDPQAYVTIYYSDETYEQPLAAILQSRVHGTNFSPQPSTGLEEEFIMRFALLFFAAHGTGEFPQGVSLEGLMEQLRAA